jgi:hypothetical protein
MLLVDSEDNVAAVFQKGLPENWNPWGHLRQRAGDRWAKPINAENFQCHLMVPCMEVLFLADKVTLAGFYGQGFKSNNLPRNPDLESISKVDIFKALSNATRYCNTKGNYSKGDHSFLILSRIDTMKAATTLPWIKRFLNEILSRQKLPLIQ